MTVRRTFERARSAGRPLPGDPYAPRRSTRQGEEQPSSCDVPEGKPPSRRKKREPVLAASILDHPIFKRDMCESVRDIPDHVKGDLSDFQVGMFYMSVVKRIPLTEQERSVYYENPIYRLTHMIQHRGGYYEPPRCRYEKLFHAAMPYPEGLHTKGRWWSVPAYFFEQQAKDMALLVGQKAGNDDVLLYNTFQIPPIDPQTGRIQSTYGYGLCSMQKVVDGKRQLYIERHYPHEKRAHPEWDPVLRAIFERRDHRWVVFVDKFGVCPPSPKPVDYLKVVRMVCGDASNHGLT